MSVACLDGPKLTQFVEDSEAFEKCVNEQFDMLDIDGDGVLSREELQARSGKVSSMEYELQSKEEIRNIYDLIFEKFDADENGGIDREEFRELMKEIVLAKAHGIGNSPVLVILQGDSLLMKAVKHGDQLAQNE